MPRVGRAEDACGADVGEARQAEGDRRLEHGEAADQVDRRPRHRVAGAVDGHHAREVDRAVAAGHGGADRGGVPDVAGDAIYRRGEARLHEFQLRGVRTKVEDPHRMPAPHEAADHPGADEAGTAGDEHRLMPPRAGSRGAPRCSRR